MSPAVQLTILNLRRQHTVSGFVLISARPSAALSRKSSTTDPSSRTCTTDFRAPKGFPHPQRSRRRHLHGRQGRCIDGITLAWLTPPQPRPTKRIAAGGAGHVAPLARPSDGSTAARRCVKQDSGGNDRSPGIHLKSATLVPYRSSPPHTPGILSVRC